MQQPFYDPNKTYEENYNEGPFGAFTDGIIFPEQGEPTTEIFGQKVYVPFGIPAGPLVNGDFITAAFDKGFDIAIYKTVRSQQYIANAFPNIVPLAIQGNLTLEQANKGVTMSDSFRKPLNITNSFGVPSFPPEVWQEDMKRTVEESAKRKGKLLIGSFQGTVRPDQSAEAYIHDFAKAAKMVKETGVKVMEVNLSCPNEGSQSLLCFDTTRAKEVVFAIKEAIGETPLIIKIAYFEDEFHLQTLITTVGKYVQGIAAINTIPAKIYKDEAHTEQAIPGEKRLISGVCGSAIKWAGIESVKRLKDLREKLHLSYTILGGGGVMTPADYQEYRQAGADVIMSATGAMWNPYLAQEIKSVISKQ